MNWKTITGLFNQSERREPRVVPKVEPAPVFQPSPFDYPLVMKQEDIDRYHEAAQAAKRLAEEANNRLQTYHIQDTTAMNHIFQNPKTSVAGVLAALPLFGIAVSSFVAGDIGNGIAHAVVGIGVLLGLLQASDADRVAKTLGSIIPKIEKQQNPQ